MRVTSAVRIIVALLAGGALLTSCTGDGTTLDLLGEPLAPPAIQVMPADLELSLIEDTSQAVSIEITNQGGLPLRVADVSSPASFILTDFTGAFEVASGETATVVATIMAGAATSSPRPGLIQVSSNDPEMPTASVPLRLVVTLGPQPEIVVSPDSLTVRVAPEGTDVGMVTVWNTGTGPLSLASIVGGPFLSPGIASAVVAAGDSIDVVVTADAAGFAAGTYEGALTITSDDEDEGMVSVPVLLSVETPFPATLSAIQDSVFTPRCTFDGCHSLPFPALDLLLQEGATYGSTVGVVALETELTLGLLIVEPGDAPNSYLVIKVDAGDGRRVGQNMPPIGDPLTVGEIKAIRRWINEGAQNN